MTSLSSIQMWLSFLDSVTSEQSQASCLAVVNIGSALPVRWNHPECSYDSQLPVSVSEGTLCEEYAKPHSLWQAGSAMKLPPWELFSTIDSRVLVHKHPNSLTPGVG